MTPILSIITINRNNAEGLRKTIESVLSQEYITPDQLEYIIIDGASSDDSVKVINEYLNNSKYSNKISYWISEPDTGIYNAMNKGIKKAKGSLIGLMHSGDWYLPKAFENLINIHNNSPQKIIYGALKAVHNGKFESVWGQNAEILPKQMIPHLSTFVPKIIYNKIGLFDETYKIAADYELFLRFYTNKVDFIFIDKIICCFNLEGISQNDPKTKIETDLIKKKYGFYEEPTKKQKIKNIIKKILHW